MKYLLSLIGLGTVTSCTTSVNKQFDQDINTAIAPFKITQTTISDEAFRAFAGSIYANGPLAHPGPQDLTAYSLTGYINTAYPTIEEALKRYRQLKEHWRFTFFNNMLISLNPLFREHKQVLHELISEAVPNKNQATTKELLLLYTREQPPTIDEFVALLRGKKLTLDDQFVLSKLVVAEREHELGLSLLKYIYQDKEAQHALPYIYY